jgi:hypothetical protein
MSVNGVLPFESIDRLMAVEMRPRSLPQGYVPQFYRYARGDGPPIAYTIADALTQLEPGNVAIFCGVFIPPYLDVGEMDGPPGAVVLGDALQRLGHQVQIIVESPQVEAVRTLAVTAGATDVDVSDADTAIGDDVARYAEGLGAAIAIEKIGANVQGIRHSVFGTPLDAMDARPDLVFDHVNARGGVTIGIGDGGNEIGFGALKEAHRILGPAAHCRCGCAGGIIAAVATRHLLPCLISNVGAYATTAALALTLGRSDLVPRALDVRMLLEAGQSAGLLDGGTLDPAFLGDDSVPAEAVCAMVELLGTIVTQQMRELSDRPF